MPADAIWSGERYLALDGSICLLLVGGGRLIAGLAAATTTGEESKVSGIRSAVLFVSFMGSIPLFWRGSGETLQPGRGVLVRGRCVDRGDARRRGPFGIEQIELSNLPSRYPTRAMRAATALLQVQARWRATRRGRGIISLGLGIGNGLVSIERGHTTLRLLRDCVPRLPACAARPELNSGIGIETERPPRYPC
jgi:hypothetical protein